MGKVIPAVDDYISLTNCQLFLPNLEKRKIIHREISDLIKK